MSDKYLDCLISLPKDGGEWMVHYRFLPGGVIGEYMQGCKEFPNVDEALRFIRNALNGDHGRENPRKWDDSNVKYEGGAG